MWYAQRGSSSGDPELITSIQELLHTTSRGLVLVSTVAYLVWHVVVTLAPEFFGAGALWGPLAIAPVVFLTCGLVLWLLPRHFLAAQAVWQIGFAAAVTVAIAVLQQPTAAVTAGWPAAIAAELLLAGLIWWVLPSVGVPNATPAFGTAVILAGALAGLRGLRDAQFAMTSPFLHGQVSDAVFRYSMTSHRGDWREGRAREFGWGVPTPLTPVWMRGPKPGTLSLGASFCQVDQPGVRLLTLTQAEGIHPRLGGEGNMS